MDKKDSLILLILSVCLVVFPFIVTNTYYISTMVFVGINGIIAIGLSLLMGYAGQISIGHAAFFGLGAYTSAVLTAKLGFHPWSAFFLGILLSSCIALIIGIPSLKLKGHYLAMATLGFGEITYIVFNELTDITGGPSGIGDIPKISLAGYVMNTDIKYYFFVTKRGCAKHKVPCAFSVKSLSYKGTIAIYASDKLYILHIYFSYFNTQQITL